MNNKTRKVGWFIMFLIVGALSCWATASSFMLIIPLPWYIIWAMTIVFFVFASYSYKMIKDEARNCSEGRGKKSTRIAKLLAAVFLFVMTWGVISMPTNAHTFFYKLQIGNVVTEDLKTTEKYTEQLAHRLNISKYDSTAYCSFKKDCDALMNDFENEANGTGLTGERFISKYSLRYVAAINKELGIYGNYHIEPPMTTRNMKDTHTQIELTRNRLHEQYSAIEDQKLKVSKKDSYLAKESLNKIKAMQDTINYLIMVGQISSTKSEPIIKQTDGVLTLAYSNIKTNEKYVYFNTDEDNDLYTSDYIETRTSRFLHPYKVFGDFFVGKIPFIFISWIILSILLDLIGFVSFDKAFEDNKNQIKVY